MKKYQDIIKIVNSLEVPDLLIKSVTETIKNEAKEQKGVFLGILLGTLGAITAYEGTIRAGGKF